MDTTPWISMDSSCCQDSSSKGVGLRESRARDEMLGKGGEHLWLRTKRDNIN